MLRATCVPPPADWGAPEERNAWEASVRAECARMGRTEYGSGAYVEEFGNVLAAKRHAARGRPVFPCALDKRPLTPHGFKDASTDPAVIDDWWRRYPDALVGIQTGKASGLVVVDIDRKSGKDGLQALKTAGLALPRTVTVKSRSGGLHFYYQYTFQIGSPGDWPVLGIDIKGDGGCITAPCPGTGWDWHPQFLPDRTPIASPPGWLERRWAEREHRINAPPVPKPPPRPGAGAGRNTERLVNMVLDDIRLAQPGDRQRTLFTKAIRLGAIAKERGLNPRTTLAALLAATQDINKAGDWDAKGALATARRGFDHGVR